jgi:hypothetical protein
MALRTEANSITPFRLLGCQPVLMFRNLFEHPTLAQRKQEAAAGCGSKACPFRNVARIKNFRAGLESGKNLESSQYRSDEIPILVSVHGHRFHLETAQVYTKIGWQQRFRSGALGLELS